MKTFAVINRASGQEVYRYNHDVVLDFDGYPSSDFAHVEVAAPMAFSEQQPRRLTKLQFVELFGDARYLTLKALAATNPGAALWLDKFSMVTPEADGTSIDRADPRTRAGLEYLTAIPELSFTQADVETLLGGY